MRQDDFFPSKYLRAGDLEDGDMILTIDNVKGEDFDGEIKPVVRFREEKKGLVLNRTNWGTIEHLHGRDTESWMGKQIQLFTTEVDYRGQQTSAIRIRSEAPSIPVPQNNGSGITKDQIGNLSALYIDAYGGQQEARTALRQVLDFLGVQKATLLSEEDYTTLCELLGDGKLPDNWKVILRPITDDDIPF